MLNFRVSTIVLGVILLSVIALAAPSRADYYSPHELNELMGPVALYPDPLLAQILPAATYPDELYDASQYLANGGSRAGIDDQNWDVSVKAVAHYPNVLNYMVDHPDWTIAVGQAYVNQPSDVFASIQVLRHRARSYGYFATNRYQRVYVQSNYVYCDPVQPQYIYVPEYNPEIVYVHRRSSISSFALVFGAGLLIGVWLDRDCDWHHHRIFYHGWRNSGWEGRSRRYVHYDDPHYVNSNFARGPIPVGRDVTTRDISGYRQSVRKNAGSYTPPRHTGRLTPGYGRPGGAQGHGARPNVTTPSHRPTGGAQGHGARPNVTTPSHRPTGGAQGHAARPNVNAPSHRPTHGAQGHAARPNVNAPSHRPTHGAQGHAARPNVNAPSHRPTGGAQGHATRPNVNAPSHGGGQGRGARPNVTTPSHRPSGGAQGHGARPNVTAPSQRPSGGGQSHRARPSMGAQPAQRPSGGGHGRGQGGGNPGGGGQSHGARPNAGAPPSRGGGQSHGGSQGGGNSNGSSGHGNGGGKSSGGAQKGSGQGQHNDKQGHDQGNNGH